MNGRWSFYGQEINLGTGFMISPKEYCKPFFDCSKDQKRGGATFEMLIKNISNFKKDQKRR